MSSLATNDIHFHAAQLTMWTAKRGETIEYSFPFHLSTNRKGAGITSVHQGQGELCYDMYSSQNDFRGTKPMIKFYPIAHF